MKLLLVTQLLLWAAGQPKLLSAVARKLLNDAHNELLFSAVSLWKIAIKTVWAGRRTSASSRLPLRGLLDNRCAELPVTSQHAVGIDSLPHLQKDPSDRLLVAQALSEGMTLLTTDAQVALYPRPVRQV